MSVLQFRIRNCVDWFYCFRNPSLISCSWSFIPMQKTLSFMQMQKTNYALLGNEGKITVPSLQEMTSHKHY